MKPKIIEYQGLSSKEIDLLTRLEYEGKEIYTRKDIISFCKSKSKAAYLIRRLLMKGRLKSIVKNVYLFIPMKAPKGKWAGNEYVVAKALARGANYYIGYSNVFNFYGFTEQVAKMIHVINDRYSLKKVVGAVRYKMIKVLPDRLYGIEKREISGEIITFASKERALIDVFEFYNIKKSFAILTEQKEKIDMDVFLNFVSSYPVQITRRRIGYFLEKLAVEKKYLKRIDVGKAGYSYLYDTANKRGVVDKRWRIIING